MATKKNSPAPGAGLMNPEAGQEMTVAASVEVRPLDSLVAYARNSKKHDDAQVGMIAASIAEFGWTVPILADKNGIVAGHGRALAAAKLYAAGKSIRLPGGQELPHGTVPVIDCTGWSEAQRKAYVIADNRLTEVGGSWDYEMLAVEMDELRDMNFDLDVIGFSAEELNDLIGTPNTGPESVEGEDDAPEPPESPVTIAGDVWLLGKHRLMCGDSTSIDAVEKVMAGGKADMIFTDPPYGVDYEGINNDSREGLTDLLDQVFANYVISAKPGAPIYVFHSDRCADIFHTAFRTHFHFSSMVIWVKPSLVLSQTDYQSRHEPCLYGWTEGAAHSWHSDRKQTSVWEFGKESVAGHTTPKPVAMVSYAIENSSKRGGVVADFFGGSGSTLIGCEQTGRHGRLVEIDPKYCDVIVKRWQEFTGQHATLEGDGRTFDEIAEERIGEGAEA